MADEVARVLRGHAEVLDTPRLRGGAAWQSLRGGPVRPPIGARRWPWALAAAVLGAAAGAVTARLSGRLLLGRDVPGAQAPEDLEAVVDRGEDLPDA